MSITYVNAELRRLVIKRASNRCEYCLVPAEVGFSNHEVDHIIAEKHGGKTEANNLAYCCRVCNQLKGSDIASIDPQSGEIIPLFNPRLHDYAEHFSLKEDGSLQALTSHGRVTVNLLQLNRTERQKERALMIALGLF